MQWQKTEFNKIFKISQFNLKKKEYFTNYFNCKVFLLYKELYQSFGIGLNTEKKTIYVLKVQHQLP